MQGYEVSMGNTRDEEGHEVGVNQSQGEDEFCSYVGPSYSFVSIPQHK